MLLEQYTEARAALLEGLALDPGHSGMQRTMAAVDAAIGTEPTSPTSPAAAPAKRSALRQDRLKSCLNQHMEPIHGINFRMCSIV